MGQYEESEGVAEKFKRLVREERARLSVENVCFVSDDKAAVLSTVGRVQIGEIKDLEKTISDSEKTITDLEKTIADMRREMIFLQDILIEQGEKAKCLRMARMIGEDCDKAQIKR